MSKTEELIARYEVSEPRASRLVELCPLLTVEEIADKAGLEEREDDPSPEEYGVEKDE